MTRKITLAALALALVAGVCGAADGKYAETAAYSFDGGANGIHDAGLYRLTIQTYLATGNQTGGDGTGNYPGPSGVGTLYMGWLWVGTNAWGTPRVSASGYGAYEWYRVQGTLWSDNSNWSQRPAYITQRGNLDSYLRCDDRNGTEGGPIGLVVEQHGMQWSDGPNDDYIIFQYDITNNSGRDLADEFVGLYYDFDIGGSLSYYNDYVGIDYQRKMPYMYDDTPSHPYAGLRIMEGSPHSLGVPDIMTDPDTDALKWKAMTSGKWTEANTASDWRLCLSSGPHPCVSGQKLRYAFAVVAGANLAALQANSDAAWNKYWGIFLGVDRFYARAVPAAVEVNWEPNLPYVGFNLYRDEKDGRAARTRVNRELITGRKPYRFLDANVTAGVTYEYTLEAVKGSGVSEWFGPAEATAQGKAAPASFALAQNYPNPARGSTTIAFTLAAPADVELDVYDLAGRKMGTAASGRYATGEHKVAYDVRGLAPGVYVYRLRAGAAVATRRLAVVD